MGADVDCRDGRLPPLRVRGSRLHGIDYEMPIASAQVKSCLLLAGLLAEGETAIHEPLWTRDHTERMLAAMGAAIRREGDALIVSPAERLEAGDVPVPGDFSSAAFFIAGALLVPGSEVELREVGINRNRIGLLSILSRMGVEMGGAHEEGRAMTVHDIREPGPEPIATLHVRSTALHGTEITARRRPRRDRRAAAARAARLLRRRRDRGRRRRGAPGQGVGPDRRRGRGPVGPRRGHRGAARRLRGSRDGRPAGREDRRRRRPPPGDGGRDRGPRLTRRASRSTASRPSRSATRASSATCARYSPEFCWEG